MAIDSYGQLYLALRHGLMVGHAASASAGDALLIMLAR